MLRLCLKIVLLYMWLEYSSTAGQLLLCFTIAGSHDTRLTVPGEFYDSGLVLGYSDYSSLELASCNLNAVSDKCHLENKPSSS